MTFEVSQGWAPPVSIIVLKTITKSISRVCKHLADQILIRGANNNFPCRNKARKVKYHVLTHRQTRPFSLLLATDSLIWSVCVPISANAWESYNSWLRTWRGEGSQANRGIQGKWSGGLYDEHYIRKREKKHTRAKLYEMELWSLERGWGEKPACGTLLIRILATNWSHDRRYPQDSPLN